MPWIGGAIMGGASLLSGIIGSSQAAKSQAAANEMNRQIALDANLASAEQAQRLMEFQSFMRGTQYRAATYDMQQAGLNPMLAYQQGGAGTPQGAMGQVHVPRVERIPQPLENMGQILASGFQLDNVRADTELKEEQRENVRAEVIQKLASAGHLKALEAQTRQNMMRFEEELKKLAAEAEMSFQQLTTYLAEQRWLRDPDPANRNYPPRFNEQMRAKLDGLIASARETAEHADLLRLQKPEATAEAKMWTELGKGGKYAERATDMWSKILHGAGQVMRRRR